MELNCTPQPYLISTEGDFYKFITKDNSIYRIALANIDSAYCEGFEHIQPFIYSLSLVCLEQSYIEGKPNNNHSDHRIGETVCHLINELLVTDPNLVIFYIAEDNDGRQNKRTMKFKRWYGNYFSRNELNHLVFNQFSLPWNSDFNGSLAHAGYILNVNNPEIESVQNWSNNIQREANQSKGQVGEF